MLLVYERHLLIDIHGYVRIGRNDNLSCLFTFQESYLERHLIQKSFSSFKNNFVISIHASLRVSELFSSADKHIINVMWLSRELEQC
jgi:hypothetical protein